MNQFSNQAEEPQTSQQEEPQEKENKAASRLNQNKELLKKVEERSLPEAFKLGRDANFQLAKVRRDLFSDIREKESGNYIVSGDVIRKVSETDFEAFCFAAGQILYNQSFLIGNEETNSGIRCIRATGTSEDIGKMVRRGEITTTLNELCVLGYGWDKASEQQRKAMSTLLECLDGEKVTITFPNGRYSKRQICSIAEEDFDPVSGAKEYLLYLHPIFCENVARNFSLFPQDVMKRLAVASKKLSAEHIRLLKLLAAQDKRKPFVRHIGTLLEELGIDEDAYRKNRRQTEKQILQICEGMKGTGIITDFKAEEKEGQRGKKFVEKITFKLNPDFPTPRRKKEEPQQDETGKEKRREPQGE